eukprot:GEZU01032620.1.p1 GENE.GEZU01032620.1~~GEZU01032620.1.p1  ORF type:complete len:622 (+),score=111.81 GEZU01032620.1:48-1868(+)
MGKAARIKKIKKERTNPTGLPSVAEALQQQAEAEVGLVEDVDIEEGGAINTKPILQLINSAEASEREQACNAIANVVEDSNDLMVLMNGGVIKKLSERLCDPVRAVRTAAAGAMRNLTIAGGDEVCEKMIDDDVMTVLLVALIDSLALVKRQQHEQLDELMQAEAVEATRTAKQAIPLLSFLCESSDKGTKLFTNSNAVPLLLELFTLPNVNEKLVLTAAQCLNVVTDENAQLTDKIRSMNWAVDMLFQKLADTSLNIYIRVSVAGILFNLRNASDEEASISVITKIWPTLYQTLEFQPIPSLSQILPNLVNDEKEKVDVYKKWLAHTSAQKMSLEIITNIVSSTVATAAGDDIADDMMDDEDFNEDDLVQDANNNDASSLSAKLMEFLKQQNLFQKVSEKCVELSRLSAFPLLRSSVPSDCDLINLVFTRSISCLGNMVMNFDEATLASYDMNGMWSFLCELCIICYQEQQSSYATAKDANNGSPTHRLEVATGILFSILRRPKIAVKKSWSRVMVCLNGFRLSSLLTRLLLHAWVVLQWCADCAVKRVAVLFVHPNPRTGVPLTFLFLLSFREGNASIITDNHHSFALHIIDYRLLLLHMLRSS